MTRDRRLVAGLDLGTTKTCAVIAEVAGDLPRHPMAKVLGVGLAKSAGMRRGIVRDIDETTRSVSAALRDAERMAGAKVPAVTCGVAGEHVIARGLLGRRGREQRRDSRDRCRARERGGACDFARAGPRAPAWHPAGVHGRPPARDLGPDRHDGHSARGRDVPRDDPVDGRPEPAQERPAGGLSGGRPRARAARRLLRGPDGRREGAGRRAGRGGWRVDGRGDLSRSEDPPPRVAQGGGHARDE